MNTHDTELQYFELNSNYIETASGGVFPIIPILALGVASAIFGYQAGRDLARR